MDELIEAVKNSTIIHIKKPGQTASLYANLMQAYKQTGYRDPRLDITPPLELAYLWDIFWELSRSRPSDGFGGLSGISNVEFRAWMELNDVRLSLWELQVLKKMDVTYITTVLEKVK